MHGISVAYREPTRRRTPGNSALEITVRQHETVDSDAAQSDRNVLKIQPEQQIEIALVTG